jgi:DNA sulfur modification protein DndB
LSAIYTATAALLSGLEIADQQKATDLAIDYWDEIAKHIPEWQLVREGRVSSGEIRQDFIHSHGIALHAFGNVGNHLFAMNTHDWRAKLKPLRKINWSRTNTSLWEGRAMIGGRLSKATQNVVLTTAAIKLLLGLSLTAEENKLSDAMRG